ncbi:MAG: sodium:solute symporter [candidate division KSB1 bacterium]|nr:sodium:solute symporter [candidate division KSB1 bacterium]
MSIATVDLAVIGGYLIAVTILGFWFGSRMRSSHDYFLGGRRLPWWAVSLSIVATETSTLTFIGVPALAYASNMAFLQLTLGYFLARVVVSLLFLPAYYRGDLYTAYQFLEQRLGRRAHRFASLVFVVTRVLADGVRLFATAIPLALVARMSYPKAIAVICAATAIYTFVGGIRAVVWMDVIQIVIYLAGAALALAAMVHAIPGGWHEILRMGQEAGKLTWFVPTFDLSLPYTIWSGVIGGTFLTMASHGTDQLMVQRLLTCRNVRDSQRALIGSGVLIVAQFFFFLLIGVALYAFFRHFPLAEGLSRPDEVFPLFIVRHLPAGVSGLVIAAIFAAAMSTLSGTLNSLASSTVLDLYKSLARGSLSPRGELLLSRLVTLFWTAALLGVAALASSWGNVLEVGLTIASFTYGALLGTFLLGRLGGRATETGALVGMASGLVAMLWLSTTRVAWPWYVFVGTSVTFTVGLLASHLQRLSPPRNLP